MAKKDNNAAPTCGQCMWLTTKWHDTSCAEEGITPDETPCPKFEQRVDISSYRKLPPMQRVRNALRSGDGYSVPVTIGEELRKFLKSSRKDYLPKSTDNILLSKRLAARMAELQAYRDRTVFLLDIISTAKVRTKTLLDETRFELAQLRDVQALSTVKARDQMIDEIMRPLIKKYEYITQLKDMATSVMFNIKSGLDVCDQIAQLHQMHMRLK